MSDIADVEVHELDEALGDIHRIAIGFAMVGEHTTALKLAAAHEKIQNWIIEHDKDLA